MKIAMIGQKGLPAIYGGVEAHVHELSVGLVQHGHDVTAYGRAWYTQGKSDPVDGVTIQLIPTLHTKHLDTIVHTFLSTIHAIKQGFDVIHYHGVGPALLSWIPRIFAPGTKVIATFHSIDRYHQKWGIFARLALRLGEWTVCHFPHRTITVSKGLKQYCLNEFSADTLYIPNGVNVKTKTPSEIPLTEFHLEKNKYLVMVSRLVPHKGAHVLIEAFNRLKQEHAHEPMVKDLKLAIVGGSVYTDEYVAALHQLAGVTNNIIFTGFQSGDSLASLYAHAKLLVHPSLNEGLPMTVLAAMSYGTPVLLSHIPEHMELVTDPRCLFPENDVTSLKNKLHQWLQLNDEEHQAISVANKETIERQYEWNTIIPSTVQVYSSDIDLSAATVKSSVS